MRILRGTSGREETLLILANLYLIPFKLYPTIILISVATAMEQLQT